VAIASTQQSELEVKSRINGKVFSVLKKQGEMVTAQTPIAIIGENAHLYVELQIDENDIRLVAPDQHVYISMDSYKDSVFEAVVSKIYPMMNERSRTITVEAEFARKPPIIYPNLTVEANIVIRSKEKALLIPRNYLVNDTYVLDRKKNRMGCGIINMPKFCPASARTVKS
jgi:multidrug efflux pump subunit AcrA (membrane-fusion protein)